MASSKRRTRTKVVQAVKPWSSETAWWVLALEAVVAVGIGVYALTQPTMAITNVTYILAAFLLVDGCATIFSVLRHKGGRMFHFASSGVAILAGLLVLTMALLNIGDLAALAWILGLAFVLAGFFNLLALFFERSGPIRWVRVVVSLLMIVLGGVYVYSSITKDLTAMTSIAWLLLAVGVMLGLYAAFVWSQTRKSGGETATPAAAKSAAATPPAAKPSQAAKSSAPAKPPAKAATLPAKATTPPAVTAAGSTKPKPPSVDGGASS